MRRAWSSICCDPRCASHSLAVQSCAQPYIAVHPKWNLSTFRRLHAMSGGAAPAPLPSAPIAAPDGAAPLGELQPPEGAFATSSGGNGSDSGGGSWFGGWFGGGSKPPQVSELFSSCMLRVIDSTD